MMYLLDVSFPEPAKNLALDEALLESAESHGGPEALRFWESPKHFVVLGAGCKVQEDVHVEKCKSDGVEILRRCSGGGTVLQGPGCLNFQLVLDSSSRPDVATIDWTNRVVLEKVSAAMEDINVCVSHRGTSDLAVNDMKISGTAQRRKKRFVLFHGTLLYDFDLSLVARYLCEPVKQPDYRTNRVHDKFVSNLTGVTSQELKTSISRKWEAHEILSNPPLQLADELIITKYLKDDWNLRF